MIMKFDDICNSILERVFHGTPHDVVGNFDLNKIGSGEGNYVFGWGLYFGENPKVAEHYRGSSNRGFYKINGKIVKAPHWQDIENDEVTPEEIAVKVVYGLPEYRRLHELQHDRKTFPNKEKAMKAIDLLKQNKLEKIEGNIYQVEILADKENDFLDWDKPASEQSENVIKSYEAAFLDRIGIPITSPIELLRKNMGKDPLGSDLYWTIENDPKAASLRLKNFGIKGVKYFDQFSRSELKGTYNYVVFDPSIIKIVAKNGEFVMNSKKPENVEI